jgi:CRISPR-associated endonuclease/helicase Cas3
MTHYAHSLPGEPEERWQVLEHHLNEVGEMAETFAAPFSPGWGRLLGLWHDAGKYQRAFQDYIREDSEAHVRGKVDHSSVGALIAKDRQAALLAFAVAGHHGGMPNGRDLADRLARKQDLLTAARSGGLPRWIEEQPMPAYPGWLTERVSLSMWTRFLFSALVDADFLGTERFYAGGRERDLGSGADLGVLQARLNRHLERKSAEAIPSPVNDMRARVLSAARAAAQEEQGTFTLTVPTGGGKTLTSLSFAIDHALRRGLRRIIVVIPYTSIIEQTAAEYRRALGEDSVIEHHTNVDLLRETAANRLASENWDGQVIVTTSVQFFESLYANRPARCRKLHRIARSVVVFDEVQTFPVHLLTAVRHAVAELTSHYGVTAVLCTATQPVLFPGAREIVPRHQEEFEVVAKRCKVLMPESEEPVSWEALAAEIQGYEQVMAIVHRRDDAQRLAELAGNDCLHLSARMCARHRSAVLAEVKRRLANGERCRLVATQLVEAGVDVSFPEVYRAFAGADSLAQAAGRCNREGRGSGRLHVFIPPTKPPRGILRTAEQVARIMWREGILNLAAPATFSKYFRNLYGMAEQDASAVMAAEGVQDFVDAAERFRMIEETGQPVVAPYGDWESAVGDIRRLGISRVRMRRLQPLMVTLYRHEIEELLRAEAVERVADAFWAVVPGFRIYSRRWGFGWASGLHVEPEDLIA